MRLSCDDGVRFHRFVVVAGDLVEVEIYCLTVHARSPLLQARSVGLMRRERLSLIKGAPLRLLWIFLILILFLASEDVIYR